MIKTRVCAKRWGWDRFYVDVKSGREEGCLPIWGRRGIIQWCAPFEQAMSSVVPLYNSFFFSLTTHTLSANQRIASFWSTITQPTDQSTTRCTTSGRCSAGISFFHLATPPLSGTPSYFSLPHPCTGRQCALLWPLTRSYKSHKRGKATYAQPPSPIWHPPFNFQPTWFISVQVVVSQWP